MVGVRYPTMANICWRVSASRTARPGTARAAIAASTTLACGVPLDPNPPPMYGQMTCTCSGSTPKTPEMTLRTPCTDWAESQSVSVPAPEASHRAVVVCGSIGLLWYIAVVYVCSTVTAADAIAVSTSPSDVSVGYEGLILS